MSNFRNVNAKVLGISTDTFFALKAWDDQQKLGFPLLSDYNKEVINKYGVVNPDMIGLKNIAKRAVFVIDKSGSCPVPRGAGRRPERARLREVERGPWKGWGIEQGRALCPRQIIRTRDTRSPSTASTRSVRPPASTLSPTFGRLPSRPSM